MKKNRAFASWVIICFYSCDCFNSYMHPFSFTTDWISIGFPMLDFRYGNFCLFRWTIFCIVFSHPWLPSRGVFRPTFECAGKNVKFFCSHVFFQHPSILKFWCLDHFLLHFPWAKNTPGHQHVGAHATSCRAQFRTHPATSYCHE